MRYEKIALLYPPRYSYSIWLYVLYIFWRSVTPELLIWHSLIGWEQIENDIYFFHKSTVQEFRTIFFV